MLFVKQNTMGFVAVHLGICCKELNIMQNLAFNVCMEMNLLKGEELLLISSKLVGIVEADSIADNISAKIGGNWRDFRYTRRNLLTL